MRVIRPPAGGKGFTGRAPGGPSRWSTRESNEWGPLEPRLVVEVEYDHFTGGRFRHGTKFLRWRPDKAPAQCRLSQVAEARIAARKGTADETSDRGTPRSAAATGRRAVSRQSRRPK